MAKVNIEETLYMRLAAFVDGEGTIGIYKRRRAESGNYGYYQILKVVNSDIRLIYWLVENFGGNFPNARKEAGNRKDSYKWQLSGSDSYKLIKKIRPYLILKQEQADIAIKLYEEVTKWHYGSSPKPKHKRKLAEELYRRSRELNKRGKDNDEEDIKSIPKVVRRKVITLEEFE